MLVDTTRANESRLALLLAFVYLYLQIYMHTYYVYRNTCMHTYMQIDISYMLFPRLRSN